MDKTTNSTHSASAPSGPRLETASARGGAADDAAPKKANRGLRRRLAILLLIIAGLVLANVASVEYMSSSIRASAAVLSEHAELYKLSRRVQVAIESVAPNAPPSLDRFRQGMPEFDRDLEIHGGLVRAVDFDTSGDPQLPLLFEGLNNDWQNFSDAYGKLRRHGSNLPPIELIGALDKNADELQASVIAITFTLQRLQERRLATLEKATLAIAVADFLVLGLIMLWLRRYVVDPVERISAAAQRFANADFDARVAADASDAANDPADEIVNLGRLFNRSATRIQDLLRDLRRESAALQTVESNFRDFYEPSLTGVFLLQDDYLICITPRFAEIFGVSIDEVMKDAQLLPLLHADDRRNTRMDFGRLLDGEVPALQFDLRGVRANDGSVIPLAIFASRASYGGRPAIIGTLVELTDRQRTEEELQRISQCLNALPNEPESRC